jgi:hypothetical protein
MRRLTHAALIAIGSVAGSMMFAGTLVTGCGSSSSGDDTSEDSGPDSTEPRGDSGADTGRDSSLGSFDSGNGTGDSGEPSGDADSATEIGEGGDSGETGTEIDASDGGDASHTGEDAGDTGTETGDAGDTGTGDAGDTGTADAADTGTQTGEGGDAGDAGTETGDASDSGATTGEGGEDSASEAAADGGDGAAEAGCISSIAALADGGGVLISGFDTADVDGWSANPYVAATGGAISYSAGVGHTCPGAITLTVPFTNYGGQQVEAQYNYNPQGYPNWNGHTKLHYWVSIAFETGDAGVVLGAEAGAPYLSSLNTDFNYAQWSDYLAQDDNGNVVALTSSSFSTQEWQEVVLDLSDDRQNADAGQFPIPAGTDCLTGNACKIASVIQVASSAPVGGPAAPTTTVLYIDDIWLE